jgi:hypothetical protein
MARWPLAGIPAVRLDLQEFASGRVRMISSTFPHHTPTAE